MSCLALRSSEPWLPKVTSRMQPFFFFFENFSSEFFLSSAFSPAVANSSPFSLSLSLLSPVTISAVAHSTLHVTASFSTSRAKTTFETNCTEPKAASSDCAAKPNETKLKTLPPANSAMPACHSRKERAGRGLSCWSWNFAAADDDELFFPPAPPPPSELGGGRGPRGRRSRRVLAEECLEGQRLVVAELHEVLWRKKEEVVERGGEKRGEREGRRERRRSMSD